MNANSLHYVDPADESRHAVGLQPLWGESYYMDFVTDDGSLGGYVRVGWYPNSKVVWWTTAIVGPERPAVLSVCYDALAEDVSATSAQGLNFSVDIDVATPLEALRVRAHAVGETFADPAAVYRGESSGSVRIEMDLLWQTDGQPYRYSTTSRYEIPCLVAGSLRLDDRTIVITGQGQRDHSWGERDWWAFGWCWNAARLGDGTRVHSVDARIPDVDLAMGYVRTPAGALDDITSAEVTEELGPDGIPIRGRAVLNRGLLDLTIDPLAFGPLLLVSPEGRISRFPRAMARFTDQHGRSGLGWVEWNQPDTS
jgi:hypothetical protein